MTPLQPIVAAASSCLPAFISEIQGKEIFLFLAGAVVAVWTSFIIGRYLAFRQLIDLASAEAVNAQNLNFPTAAKLDRQAVIYSALARISGYSAQLLNQGHKEASAQIKDAATDLGTVLYAAVDLMYSEDDQPANEAEAIARTALFRSWLTIQISAYVTNVARTTWSHKVIFICYDAAPVQEVPYVHHSVYLQAQLKK